MSDKLSFLENLAMKVGAIPGLGFLQDYVHNVTGMRKRMGMEIGDRKNQVDHIRGIGKDVKDATSKKKEADD